MAEPPLLIINDTAHNYSLIFESVLGILKTRKKNVNCIDIYVAEFINDSEELNSILMSIYGQVRQVSMKYGWDCTFETNVLFNRKSFIESLDTRDLVFCDEEYCSILPINLGSRCIKFSKATDDITREQTFNGFRNSSFYSCAVGGTFDHLHDGHKILLSMTAFLSCKRLIVGITGQKLLKDKKYSEVLEPIEARETHVIKFLSKVINEDTRFEIYEINDVCGPTAQIDEIEALVVSRESYKGGEFVNKVRSDKKLSQLKVVTIGVLGEESVSVENSSPEHNWANKLSSTGIRQFLVSRLK